MGCRSGTESEPPLKKHGSAVGSVVSAIYGKPQSIYGSAVYATIMVVANVKNTSTLEPLAQFLGTFVQGCHHCHRHSRVT